MTPSAGGAHVPLHASGNEKRPQTARVLAVSQGDPAGVGPDITGRAWKALHADGPAFFVVGDAAVIAERAPNVPVTKITRPDEATGVFPTALPVLHQPCAAPVTPGTPNSANARQTITCIEIAAEITRSGAADAVVTNPIAKSVLYAAGFRHPGHTEFLDELAGPDWPAASQDGAWGPRGPVMMLVGGGLKVALATIHTPLRQVPEALTIEGLARVIEITAHALARDFGVGTPRVAVAGLNPHAGEAGALGDEEQACVIPAIARAQSALDQARLEARVTGPFAADALFHAERRASYDAVVALYHDQGLIPVKTLDFYGGVNATLGLPLVRTSPDHGTAFDIAGTPDARPDSLIAALKLADAMAAARRATPGLT